VFKNQLIQLRTLREEAFGETLFQVKIANNRYCCRSVGDEWVAQSSAACEPIRLSACLIILSVQFIRSTRSSWFLFRFASLCFSNQLPVSCHQLLILITLLIHLISSVLSYNLCESSHGLTFSQVKSSLLRKKFITACAIRECIKLTLRSVFTLSHWHLQWHCYCVF